VTKLVQWLLGLLMFALPATLPAESIDRQQVEEALAVYADNGSVSIPELSDKQLLKLLQGKPIVLTHYRETDSGKRVLGVTGLHRIDRPSHEVWLTLLGKESDSDRLTRIVLAEPNLGERVQYQHLNMPWPFKDRQWVIHIMLNEALAEHSEQRIWEQHWRLADDGEQQLEAAIANGTEPPVSLRRIEKSLYLPSNRGAWAVARVSDSTSLVIARVEVDLGGLIPKGMVRSKSRKRLRERFVALQTEVDDAVARYDNESPIASGSGRPLRLEMEPRQ